MPRPESMRAVIFKDIGEMTVEDRPTPKIQHPRDAILKVTSTALCGSDLVCLSDNQQTIQLADGSSISIVAT